MTITTYTSLPPEAMAIRQTVFVQEQGFEDIPDAHDPVALHFVLFEDGNPIGTCRAYPDGDSWMLGRLAILKPHRGRGLGAKLVAQAESSIRQAGGSRIVLHAQQHAAGFYRRIGFFQIGQPDAVQGCPHIWMEKGL